MKSGETAQQGLVARQRRRLLAILAALAVTTAACEPDENDSTAEEAAADQSSIELRDETGPHVDAPDRAMAMTVDAVEFDGDDILIRLRVENSDDGYLDMGVQDTIYGPLLVMRDDQNNVYEARAVEPAGIPGRRIADLSFRLDGPLDRNAESFTLELATQRGPLITPSAELPTGDGVRWRIGDVVAGAMGSADADRGGAEPGFASAPRLPDLIHFWLETDPLPADR